MHAQFSSFIRCEKVVKDENLYSTYWIKQHILSQPLFESFLQFWKQFFSLRRWVEYRLEKYTKWRIYAVNHPINPIHCTNRNKKTLVWIVDIVRHEPLRIVENSIKCPSRSRRLGIQTLDGISIRDSQKRSWISVQERWTSQYLYVGHQLLHNLVSTRKNQGNQETLEILVVLGDT